MFRLAPRGEQPERFFCLDGTIYPHNPMFDWSNDVDVLADAVRDTHVAIRMHQIAKMTNSRDWLRCECEDVAAHGRQLAAGHLALVNLLTNLRPDVLQRPQYAKRLPVHRVYLRFLHMLVVSVTSILATT